MFNCSDPAQNQLLTDKCISIEAGTPPWLSPDIFLNDTREGIQSPTSIPLLDSSDPSKGRVPADTAKQGASNQVTVRARKSCNPAGAANVIVELYVAHPGLNLTPTLNSVQVFQAVIPTGDFTPFANVTRSWTAAHPIPSPPSQPDPDPNKLHRCLIARCYPESLSATQEKFCTGLNPDGTRVDQHVAQRNIAVIPATGTTISFLIQTISQNLEIFESATIRTIVDRVPSPAVLNVVLPSLKQFEEFRQIAPIAPERFALQVPEKFSPIIRDNSHLDQSGPINPEDIPFQDRWRYVFKRIDFRRFRDVVFNPNVVLQEAVAARKFNLHRLQGVADRQSALQWEMTPALEKLVERAAPTFEAQVKLPPKEVAYFTFNATLPENSQPGDAHIFHVMHLNEKQQIVGGLTIVTVMVKSLNPEAVNGLISQRDKLVKNGFLAIFGNNSPQVQNQRQVAACLRDLNYYIEPIIESCRQGSVQPLDQFIPSVKELNTSLGYPNSWFVTFYQFIKQNHGFTGESADVVDSYLDYATAAFS